MHWGFIIFAGICYFQVACYCLNFVKIEVECCVRLLNGIIDFQLIMEMKCVVNYFECYAINFVVARP